jgi:hypothetical protein
MHLFLKPLSFQAVHNIRIIFFPNFIQVVFSDETIIELQPARVSLVRRKVGERLSEQWQTLRTGYPLKVMFWGCISILGPGCLIPIRGTMNSDDYVDIVRMSLLPVTEAWYGDDHWLLQQDNASCHTSKKSSAALMEMGIDVLKWPPSSPDLNCIENVWGILKKRVIQRLGEAHNRQSLIDLCMDIWENDSSLIDICRNVVLSMPNRLQKLKTAKGGYIGY